MKILRLYKPEASLLTLLFLCAAAALYLASCKPAAESLYKPDYPLTEDVAWSRSGSFSVKIPKGWFTTEDDGCNCLDLLLVRDDFSASISLARLNADSLGYLSGIPNEKDRMKSLIRFSQDQKKHGLKDRFSPVQTQEPEVFFINKKPYGQYVYTGDAGQSVRVLVFAYRDNYYELTALPTPKAGKANVKTDELFRIQQSVLVSLP